mgnify:CR=1 FL=1
MASFDAIVNFTLAKEAGLSNDPDDNAANYPSPYYFNGQKNWHTNKGVTYKTFETASKNIGFANTYNNFIAMPRAVWYKIAKKLYWDKLHLDDLSNQSIANLMFSWIWGSGYSWRDRLVKVFKKYSIIWDKNNFKALINNLNKLIAKYGARDIYKLLDKEYRSFLHSLNQPKFINGWLNRLDELYELNINDLLKFASKNKGSILLGIGLITASYLLKNGTSKI